MAEIKLEDKGVGQAAGSTARATLTIALPQPPSEPTPDEPTPLSSMGGGPASQGQTPLEGPGPTGDTALFYNGLFKSSFDGRAIQGLVSP